MHGRQAIDRPEGRPTGLPLVFRGFCGVSEMGSGTHKCRGWPSQANSDNQGKCELKKAKVGQAAGARDGGV
jgi:hypothetical protein